DAPAAAARYIIAPGEAALIRARRTLRAAIGKDLNAASPMRQEGQHLLVVEVNAGHAHDALHVDLGRYVVVAIHSRIQPVEAEKLRRGGEGRSSEGIAEITPEGTERNLADSAEVVF